MDEPAEENYMSLDESYSGNVSEINVDKNINTINRTDTYMFFFASCSDMTIMMMIWI